MNYYKNEFLLKLFKADKFEDISDILVNKDFVKNTVEFLKDYDVEGIKNARVFLSAFILLFNPDDIIGDNYRDTNIYLYASKVKSDLMQGKCFKENILNFLKEHNKWSKNDIYTFKKNIEKTHRELLINYETSNEEKRDELAKELKKIENTYFELTGDIIKEKKEKKSDIELYKEIKNGLILLFPHSADEIDKEIDIELYYALNKKGKEIYYDKIVKNVYYYSSKHLEKNFENIDMIIDELIISIKKFNQKIHNLSQND